MESLLQIRLLGGCAISIQGAPISGLQSPRLQALLGYLALHRDAPLSRAQVAFQLWPDSTEAQALANLRGLLRRLRIALPPIDQLLRSERQSLTWDARIPWSLDVAAFQTALEAAHDAEQAGDLPTARTQLQMACRLYQGDLLPGLYDEWLLSHREQLRNACLEASERLAALAEQQGDTPAAIVATRQVLQLDGLREPAHRSLIRLLAHSGDRAGALRAYHNCVTTLERELGTGPSAATVQAYEQAQRVDHAAAPPPALAPPAIITPLVGRRQEYASLQLAWHQTSAGAPGVVLIVGETGIGKTRLAETLAAWLERQGVPVATAACYATTGTLAYAPVVTWLRELPLPPLAAPWLRELSRLLPELLAVQPDLPSPAPLSEPWQRTRFFQALGHGLLSGRHALFLILDDLQWCDPDTLDWLQFLLAARHDGVRTPRLLVVATVRSEDHALDSRLHAWQAQLSRQTALTCIELVPLSRSETSELAGQTAGHALAADQHAQIYATSEGNPLFVVELVRAGLAHTAGFGEQPGGGAPAFPALPQRLRQVLDARLAQLSPEARAVIELAAVIGQAFTYQVLARAAAGNAERLVACLDEAWRRRIIREQEADSYDFSHARLRDAAYTRLSRTRRRYLHGRVAAALEAVHAHEPDRGAGQVAAHYALAGQTPQALSAYRRAAQAARRIFAHAEARAALERAVALLDELPPGVEHDQEAVQTYEDLGDLQHWQAEHAAAQQSYRAALAATTAEQSIAQARLHRKLGKAFHAANAAYDQIDGAYQTAEGLIGAPADHASADWWAEWCQLQLDQIGLLYWWNRSEQMTTQLAHVQPLIERHGTQFQRAALFAQLGTALSRRLRYAPSEQAVAYTQAALAALPPASGPEQRTGYQFRLGFKLLWNHALAEAEQTLLDVLAQAEQTGDVSLRTRCLAYLTVCYRRQERTAEVERYARRTLDAATQTTTHDYRGAALANLAWLAWRRSKLEEAQRLAQQAQQAWATHMPHYPLYWQALWPLLGVALAQGRTAEAIAAARQLLAPGQQALAPEIEALLVAALEAWAASRPTEACERLRQALALALALGHA
jgi:DNA-binding SARP family transcriptional activator